MPFNPNTYRLNLSPHYKDALDRAIDNDAGVFIPCGSKEDSMYLRMNLGKYRKAHETQHLTAKMSADITYKYAYISMDCILRESVWGIKCHVVTGTDPHKKLTLIDPQTGKSLD
jgi:hypothetical protein